MSGRKFSPKPSMIPPSHHLLTLRVRHQIPTNRAKNAFMVKPWLLEAAQPYRPVSLTAAAVDSQFYRALKRMFARPNQLCGLGDRLDYAGVFAGTALSDGTMALNPNVVSFKLHVVSMKYLEQLKMIPWFAECEIKHCPDKWSEQMGKFKRGFVKISCAFPRAQAEDLYKLFYIDGFKRIPAELLSLCSAGSRISRSTPDFLGAIMCGDGAVTDIIIEIALSEQCRGSLVEDGRKFVRYLAAPMLDRAGAIAIDINGFAGFKTFVLHEDPADVSHWGMITLRKTVNTWGQAGLILPTAPGSSSPLRTEANRFKTVVVNSSMCVLAYPHKGILTYDDDKQAAMGANFRNKNFINSRREEIKRHLLDHRVDPNDPNSRGATQDTLLSYCGQGAGNLGLSIVAPDKFLHQMLELESCSHSLRISTKGLGLYTPNRLRPTSGNAVTHRKRHWSSVLHMCLILQDVFQRTPLQFEAHVAEWKKFWDENGLVYLPPGTRFNRDNQQRRGVEELKQHWRDFSQKPKIRAELRGHLPDGSKMRYPMGMQLNFPKLIAKLEQRVVADAPGA